MSNQIAIQTTITQQTADSMSTVAIAKSNSSSASGASPAYGDLSAFAALNAITCGGVQAAMDLVREQLAQGLPTPDAEQTQAILDRAARNIEDSQPSSVHTPSNNNTVIVMVTCPTNDVPSAAIEEKNARQIIHPIQEETADENSYIEQSSTSSTDFQDNSSISTFGSAASILANDSILSLSSKSEGASDGLKKTTTTRPGLKRSSTINDVLANPSAREDPVCSTGDGFVSENPIKGHLASFIRRTIHFRSKRTAPSCAPAEIKLATPSPAIFVSPFIDPSNFLSVPTVSLMTGRRDDDAEEEDYMASIMDIVYDAREDWFDADDEEDSINVDFSSIFSDDEPTSLAQEHVSLSSPASIHDMQGFEVEMTTLHTFADHALPSSRATDVATDESICDSDSDLVTAVDAIHMSPEVASAQLGCAARGGNVVTIDEWWDASTDTSEAYKRSTRAMAIRLMSTESISGPRATRRTAAMRRRVSERIGEAFVSSSSSGRILSPIVEADDFSRACFRSITGGKERMGLRQGLRKFRQLF